MILYGYRVILDNGYVEYPTMEEAQPYSNLVGGLRIDIIEYIIDEEPS